MPLPITILILTKNEAVNLPHCLGSVVGWAEAVFVLDSGSTDQTVTLARAAGATVFHRDFDNYSAQRNHAVEALPIKTEWVLFMDADEQLDHNSRAEIDSVVNQPKALNGYFLTLKFVFMDRWIRHGGYDECSKLVLFRKSSLIAIERDMDELVIIDGPSGKLKHAIIHNDRKPVQFWYEKHARYAQFQVADLLKSDQEKTLRWADAHTKRDKKRWVKEQIWWRIPVLLRPVLYFIYRYFIQLGFLDGKAGFIYHFSHAFIYQFMIAAVYIDERNRQYGM